MKNILQASTLLMITALIAPAGALAMSIDWAGNYRFEYTEVDKTSLDSPSLRKAYMLNHLSLSPKIIAADGLNIVAKFEILTNDQYPESQAGQPFGKGPSKAKTTSSTKDDSAVAGQKNGVSNLSVSQLYMNLNQEYGSLLIGRAPLEFGLGITHNAGNGLFDHWYDVHDMVAYKFVVGNLSFTPIIGKVYDYNTAQGREAQDMTFNLLYENTETESAIGVIHQTRTSSLEANDAPFSAYGGTAVTGSWNTQNSNLYISRGFESVKIKLEAGFESGTTGISRGTEEVKLGGYGIALDLDFPTEPNNNWHWGIKAGIASGDDPTTATYEGFHFDRNYDVAFLMFNHPLGKYDLLRTAAQRSPDRTNCTAAPCSPYATDEALDDETVSNAIYVSPSVVHSMGERWDWTNRLTWAQLQVKPVSTGDVSKDLGFEWDTGFIFKPHERIRWVNELGFLFPGSAWQGTSAQKYGNSFTYGLSSKVAVSF